MRRRKGTRAGLIPAHAGKTLGGAHERASVRAHPRSRGENSIGGLGGGDRLGSSPLTRGKPIHGDSLHLVTGLIPAHAGKTPTPRLSPLCSWAHPRSRGENAYGLAPGGRTGGSSPLTRGKLLRRDNRRHVRGLIPAHAGKTIRHLVIHGHQRAHPRSRGENLARPDRTDQPVGSSPLTRGKRCSSPPP